MGLQGLSLYVTWRGRRRRAMPEGLGFNSPK